MINFLVLFISYFGGEISPPTSVSSPLASGLRGLRQRFPPFQVGRAQSSPGCPRGTIRCKIHASLTRGTRGGLLIRVIFPPISADPEAGKSASRVVRARHSYFIFCVMPGEFASGLTAEVTGQTTQYLTRSTNYFTLGNVSDKKVRLRSGAQPCRKNITN